MNSSRIIDNFIVYLHPMKILLFWTLIWLFWWWIYRWYDSHHIWQTDAKEPSIICGNHEIKIDLEYALDDVSRTKWLMYRTKLGSDHGMLFVFPEEQMRSFWMKNTLIPLDIIFIDSGYNIVHIHTWSKPGDLTPLSSLYPAQYVLEVNSGWTLWNRINIGCKVKAS